MTSAIEFDFLSNSEKNPSNGDLAILVVDNDISLDKLTWLIDVLLKLSHHSGGALVHAAPSFDFTFTHLVYSNCEICGRLSDDKYLLISNFLIFCRGSNKPNFNMILYPSHWFATHIWTIEKY